MPGEADASRRDLASRSKGQRRWPVPPPATPSSAPPMCSVPPIRSVPTSWPGWSSLALSPRVHPSTPSCVPAVCWPCPRRFDLRPPGLCPPGLCPPGLGPPGLCPPGLYRVRRSPAPPTGLRPPALRPAEPRPAEPRPPRFRWGMSDRWVRAHRTIGLPARRSVRPPRLVAFPLAPPAWARTAVHGSVEDRQADPVGHPGDRWPPGPQVPAHPQPVSGTRAQARARAGRTRSDFGPAPDPSASSRNASSLRAFWG